jgi:hypothetical protein
MSRAIAHPPDICCVRSTLFADLLNGSSAHCETFANPGPLTRTEFFTVAQVEVYVFEIHDHHARLRSRSTSQSSLLQNPNS